LLSPGNDHNSVHTIELLSKIELKGSNVIVNKAYATEEIRDFIKSKEATVNTTQ